MTTICVITKVPPFDSTSGGNLATAIPLYHQVGNPDESNDFLGTYELVPPVVSLDLYQPVFALGEIIVLDDNDREIGGDGRKPSKWLIEYETFESSELEAAIACSRKVTS